MAIQNDLINNNNTSDSSDDSVKVSIVSGASGASVTSTVNTSTTPLSAGTDLTMRFIASGANNADVVGGMQIRLVKD